jgi:WD40 repeat protein
MPPGESSRKSASSAQTPYKWTATLQEDVSTNEPQTTWSVQFALPPSPGHRAGGGRCWFSPVTEADVKAAATAAPGAAPAPVILPVDAKPVAETVGGVDDDDVIEVIELKNTDSVRADTDGDYDMVDVDSNAPNQGMSARGTGENPADAEWTQIFATCNDATVRVYKAVKGSSPVQLQIYQDPNSEETFFSVSWTFNVNGNCEWWLAAAGKRGVLRILNVSQCKLELSLIGHGESINDVKTHPRDPALVLTASKDESLRLWNLRTKSTVAVFAGLRGHRGEVLYADFHLTGNRFASCGIDNSIRIWEIDTDDKVIASIKETHDAADRGIQDVCVYEDENGQRRKARVPVVQFPIFSSHRICRHYVDCTMVRVWQRSDSYRMELAIFVCLTHVCLSTAIFSLFSSVCALELHSLSAICVRWTIGCATAIS